VGGEGGAGGRGRGKVGVGGWGSRIFSPIVKKPVYVPRRIHAHRRRKMYSGHVIDDQRAEPRLPAIVGVGQVNVSGDVVAGSVERDVNPAIESTAAPIDRHARESRHLTAIETWNIEGTDVNKPHWLTECLASIIGAGDDHELARRRPTYQPGHVEPPVSVNNGKRANATEGWQNPRRGPTRRLIIRTHNLHA